MSREAVFHALLLLALFSISLSTVGFVNDVHAYEPLVSPEPSIGSVSVGTVFRIDVALLGVENLHSFEVILYYDNDALNATQILEGPLLRSAGPTVFKIAQMKNNYDDIYGIVWVNCTLLDSVRTFNGSGIMATVEFEVIGGGGSVLEPSDTKLYDPSGDIIPHATIVGILSSDPVPPYRTFKLTWNQENFTVAVHSNSSLAGISFNQPQKELSFYVTSWEASRYFCNITIPKTLLRDNSTQVWVVLRYGTPTDAIITSNDTHTFFYLTYYFTGYLVFSYEYHIVGAEVVSEFPSVIIPPLFLVLTVFTAAMRRLWRKKPLSV